MRGTQAMQMRKRENRGYDWNQEKEPEPQKKLEEFLEKQELDK